MNIIIAQGFNKKNFSNIAGNIFFLENFSNDFYKIIFLENENSIEFTNLNSFIIIRNKSFKINIFQKIHDLFNFYNLILKNIDRKNSNKILTYMTPLYSFLLIPLKLFYKIKIYTWYSHISASGIISKISLFFTDLILTASNEIQSYYPDKTLLIPNFYLSKFFYKTKFYTSLKKKREINICLISRITRVKKIDFFIDLISKSRDLKQNKIKINIVGDPITNDDNKYINELKKKIKNLNSEKFHFNFLNSMPINLLNDFMITQDININMQEKGGMGKSIIESFASGLIILFKTPIYDRHLNKDLIDIMKFDNNNFINKLFNILEMNQSELNQISKKISSFAHNNFSDQAFFNRIKKIF